MMISKDRFTRACYMLIIALLAVIALRPILAPQTVRAFAPYKYIAVQLDCQTSTSPTPCSGALQALLDKYSGAGWELVAPIQSNLTDVGLTLIFKR